MCTEATAKKSETDFNSFGQLLKAGFLLDSMSSFTSWFFALCYWSYILSPFEWKQNIYICKFLLQSLLPHPGPLWEIIYSAQRLFGAFQCTLSSQYLWDVLPVCDTIWKQRASKVLIIHLSTIGVECRVLSPSSKMS